MAASVKRQIEADKQFKQQDSLLTTLIRGNPQIRSLHNFIMAFEAVFVVTTIGDYVSNHERFKRDYAIMCWNVRDFYPHFVLPWTFMNCTLLCLLYPLVCFRYFLQWRQLQTFAKNGGFKSSNKKDHSELTEKAVQLTQWKSVALNLTYVVIVAVGLVTFCSWYIIHYNASISISFALTMEMTRFVMKAHSYFVEKHDLVVSSEEVAKLVKSTQKMPSLAWRARPSFQALLYYLFAPTLIYRDSYPRTDRIRWTFVLMHAIQLILSVLTGFVAINRFLVDIFYQTGHEPFALSNLSRNISGLFMFGVILAMICFYGLLHLWHNITAELLRFADRRYYEAWWESVSLKDFYRTWNLLVQDWLFMYIYVPVYNRTSNRSLSAYSVIFLSGIAHEYIIGFSIKFFFPLLFVIFSICGHIYFLATRNMKRTNFHNSMFMLSNMLGWGIISTFYSLEWYSRANCPQRQNSTLTEQLVPRLFTCVKLTETIQNI